MLNRVNLQGNSSKGSNPFTLSWLQSREKILRTLKQLILNKEIGQPSFFFTVCSDVSLIRGCFVFMINE